MTVETQTQQPGPYYGRFVPLMTLLGAQAVSLDDESAVVRLPWREDINNSYGVIHGGATMSVLDFAMHAAARGRNDGLTVSTIDMSTSFLAPGNGDLTITARCLRRGSSIIFCEGEARDGQGALVAVCKASFKASSVKRPVKAV
jgi:uncharacterized protein (TIGR00369 family)